MSKTLYLGLYASTFGASILFLILTIAIYVLAENSDNGHSFESIGAIFSLISTFSFLAWLIIHIVCYFLVIYKMWDTIQDGYTEVTPGKAIGFMFIPFFNLYWIFKVFAGYPSEYNAYIARNNINAPQLSTGVFIALPIIVILTSFYIGFIALPFIMMAVIYKVCDAINAIKEAPISYSNNNFYSPPPPPRQF